MTSRTSLRLRYRLPAACVAVVLLYGCTGTRRVERPNIVVILIDTLRADHLGCYGYERPTSPAIDALAARGTLFRHASSVASYTRAATATLLTGVYPSVHGAVAYGDSISESVPTLPERFSAAGYRTAGFHLNGNIDAAFGFSRGFGSYERPGPAYRREVTETGDGPPGAVDWMPNDEAITWRVLPWLEQIAEEPFFLYLHYSGPHAPYQPPRGSTSFVDGRLTPTAELFYQRPEIGPGDKRVPPIRRMQLGELPLDDLTRRQIVDLYDGEIAFSDLQVARVLERLEQLGRLQRTIVVLLSDHGEEFWEHGGMSHGHSHYRELLHIPLVIAGPGVLPKTVDTPVSLIDLPKTLIDLAGLEPDPGLQGRSLLEVLVSRRGQLDDRPIFAEGLLRFDDAGDPVGFYRSLEYRAGKLILDGRRKLKSYFDLARDPEERHDLLSNGEAHKVAGDLFGLLTATHAENLESPWLGSGGSAAISDELAANLRALGYVGSEADEETLPIFRRPLNARVGLTQHGFLGDETEVRSYGSAISFVPGGISSSEQLLYGIKPVAGRQAILRRRAGVRLARRAEHRSWVVVGRVPHHDGKVGLDLTVRVDGGEVRAFKVTAGGRFELRGPLPTGTKRFARLDFTCEGGPLVASYGRLDELAACAFVRSISLRPSSG